jgi:DNA-binding CsgD family transcriptional regulator
MSAFRLSAPHRPGLLAGTEDKLTIDARHRSEARFTVLQSCFGDGFAHHARRFGVAEVVEERSCFGGVAHDAHDRKKRGRSPGFAHARSTSKPNGDSPALRQLLSLPRMSEHGYKPDTALSFDELDKITVGVTSGAMTDPKHAFLTAATWAGVRQRLSASEYEVLTLLAKGFSAGDIARLMELSVHTVRKSIATLREKLAGPYDIEKPAEQFVPRESTGHTQMVLYDGMNACIRVVESVHQSAKPKSFPYFVLQPLRHRNAAGGPRELVQSPTSKYLSRAYAHYAEEAHDPQSEDELGLTQEMLLAALDPDPTFRLNLPEIDADSTRRSEARITRPSRIGGLLKALGIDPESLPKKDREKIRDELFSVFKEFAAQEGLVALSPVSTDLARPVDAVQQLNPDPGFEAAIRKGAEFRTATLQREGMLSSEAMAETLGLSRQAVWARKKAKQLLGVSSGRSVRYPSWQLSPNVAQYMPTILETLGRFGEWAIYLFMTQPNEMLDDGTPLDLLEAGHGERVMEAVHSYATAMA